MLASHSGLPGVREWKRRDGALWGAARAIAGDRSVERCAADARQHQRPGAIGSRGGRLLPERHSFSLASPLAFASAVKSGNAACACLAQTSIGFQLFSTTFPGWLAWAAPMARTGRRKATATRFIPSCPVGKGM